MAIIWVNDDDPKDESQIEELEQKIAPSGSLPVDDTPLSSTIEDLEAKASPSVMWDMTGD